MLRKPHTSLHISPKVLKPAQVVVFGGGSFGTAMASALARQKSSLEVVMLMRDPYVCRDINSTHMNARYLQVGPLPAFP